MARWFQSIRIAGYPTRYEAETDAWRQRIAETDWGRILEPDAIEVRVRGYCQPPQWYGVFAGDELTEEQRAANLEVARLVMEGC